MTVEGDFIEGTEVQLLRVLVAGQARQEHLLGELLTAIGDLGTSLSSALDTETSLLSTITTTLSTFLTQWEAENIVNPGPAVRGILIVQGGQMAGQLTVDQDGNAIVGFVDDHGNATGLPVGDGSGLVATYSGDDGGALVTIGDPSVGADDAGNATETAQVVPVGPVGVVNISVALANSSGAPLTEDDGVTAFPDIAPFALTLVAGDAAAGELSVDAA